MTSVVRTYYSYQVPKSFDKSYNLELMGLWGWAELAIGIIVGCLPVAPKFFRHVGPKVLNTFAFVSKSDVQSDMSPTNGSKTADEIPKTYSFTKFHRPFARYNVGSNISESFTDPCYPQTRLDSDHLHLTANQLDSTRSKFTIAHEPTQSLGIIAASGPDDLETGRTDTESLRSRIGIGL